MSEHSQESTVSRPSARCFPSYTVDLRFATPQDFHDERARILSDWRRRKESERRTAETYSAKMREEKLREINSWDGFVAFGAFLQYLSDDEIRDIGGWLKDRLPIVEVRGATPEAFAEVLLRGFSRAGEYIPPIPYGIVEPPKRMWIVDPPITPEQIRRSFGSRKASERDALSLLRRLIARRACLLDYGRWSDSEWARALGVNKSTVSRWKRLRAFLRVLREPDRPAMET